VAANLPGQFIVLDGPDGGGKTSQAKRLAMRLRRVGLSVTQVHDPGSTLVSQHIREILLDNGTSDLDSATEVFLFMASRAQMVAEVVRPSLSRGEVIISDRFVSATMAYQGYAGGIDPDAIWRVWDLISDGLWPQLTVILDVPVEEGFRRMHGRKKGGKKAPSSEQMAFSFWRDRMESKDRAYHEKVRQGFLEMARAQPERFAVVDASGTEDAVAGAVWAAVRRVW